MVENRSDLSWEQIKQLPGKFDQDQFYILEEGGFYDPTGKYFNKDGKDAKGGYYNDQGVYIPPTPLRLSKDGINFQVPVPKE